LVKSKICTTLRPQFLTNEKDNFNSLLASFFHIQFRFSPNGGFGFYEKYGKNPGGGGCYRSHLFGNRPFFNLFRKETN